jgi:MurNAc alpha-1-phosphate uridylyltransferase
MIHPDTAMVLAAGFGTRMGQLTKNRPKPLLEVSGRSLIDRTLDHLAAANTSKAVINLHYLGDMIRHHLGGRTSPAILFSDEDPILDTGGGVVKALPLLGHAPFVTMNSDAVFAGPNPIDVLTAGWHAGSMDALLLLVPTTQTHAYTRNGDFFLDIEGDAPVRRGERDSAPYVYAGAQIVAPHVFENAPKSAFSMNVIWDRLLATGRLRAVPYPGLWVDVGTPDGLTEAGRVLDGGS